MTKIAKKCNELIDYNNPAFETAVSVNDKQVANELSVKITGWQRTVSAIESLVHSFQNTRTMTWEDAEKHVKFMTDIRI